jgi:hypothetical protein
MRALHRKIITITNQLPVLCAQGTIHGAVVPTSLTWQTLSGAGAGTWQLQPPVWLLAPLNCHIQECVFSKGCMH